jgi:glycosyltransferase A (GT-A) superfamily protein (DUF2064 family)
MRYEQANTALLIFLRNECEEARIKTFHAHLRMQRRVQIVQTLNRHVEQITRQTGLPVFVVKGDQQIGDTFGERFANAFEQVFAAGYEHVIAVGNDCLSLTKSRLLKAAEYFEAGSEVVLGPAKDGGAYIVGISRRVYRRSDFLTISWQTDGVLAALMSLASHCTLLPIACDFDDAATFQQIVTQMVGRRQIATVLYRLVFENRLQPVVEIFLIGTKFSSANALRAPPLAA